MSTIHIHARDIVHFDAVGSFARQVAVLAQGAGHDASLWAEHSESFADTPVNSREGFWDAVQPGDLVFFNHSIYDPILQRIAALSNPKLLYFHNITPPEMIDPEDGRTIENCRMGLEQRRFAPQFDVLLANSTDSAACLLDGIDVSDRQSLTGTVTICPPLIGADRWTEITAEPVALDSGRQRLLFVGRLVPHKGVLELLDLFDALASSLPDLALDLVGGPPSGLYVDSIYERAAAVSERTGAPIAIRHGISDGALKSLYQAATAAITLTRHEGFCVPALDALAFGRPMFASPLPAIREVLGGAGFELPLDAAARDGAALVASLLDDRTALATARERGRQRFAELAALADGQLILEAFAAAAKSR